MQYSARMSDDLRAELRHVFEQWFESIPAKDASFVDRSMDPGFRGIDADGVLRDFAAYKARGYGAVAVTIHEAEGI